MLKMALHPRRGHEPQVKTCLYYLSPLLTPCHGCSWPCYPHLWMFLSYINGTVGNVASTVS